MRPDCHHCLNPRIKSILRRGLSFVNVIRHLQSPSVHLLSLAKKGYISDSENHACPSIKVEQGLLLFHQVVRPTRIPMPSRNSSNVSIRSQKLRSSKLKLRSSAVSPSFFTGYPSKNIKKSSAGLRNTRITHSRLRMSAGDASWLKGRI